MLLRPAVSSVCLVAACLVAAALLVSTAASNGGEVDFEDLTTLEFFDRDPTTVQPDEFTSGDATLHLVAGSTSVNLARAQVLNHIDLKEGESGNVLGLANVEIDVDFGSTIEQLEFRIGYYGGNVELEINGNPLAPPLDPDDYPFEFNSIAIDVSDITEIPTGNVHALLSFDGTIDSFTIFGQELFIDELRFLPVPEPSTFALLLGALISLAMVGSVRGRR